MVLHPTDFSSASGSAFSRAIAEAGTRKSPLLILHVIAPIVPIVGEGYMSPAAYQEMSTASRAWAQKKLDRAVAKAKAARVRARGLLRDGSAADQIVRVAKLRKAKLIVIGTHGRTGVARFFLGSVAARVAATAPCPVLTVRGH